MIKFQPLRKKCSRPTIAWTIEASERNCPGAGICKEFCYAKKGAFVWTNVKPVHELNGDLSRRADWYSQLKDAVAAKLMRARNRPEAVRIHTAGDFHSLDYFKSWIKTAALNPDVVFYAYTKTPFVWRWIDRGNYLPANFILIKSEGSIQDEKICEGDRHARIFETRDELIAAGYDDASDDDSIAWRSESGKVGLIAH